MLGCCQGCRCRILPLSVERRRWRPKLFFLSWDPIKPMGSGILLLLLVSSKRPGVSFLFLSFFFASLLFPEEDMVVVPTVSRPSLSLSLMRKQCYANRALR